jgi:DDE family transposase
MCREIEHLMKRLVGCPSFRPKVFYHSFLYQAQICDQPRPAVSEVDWHAGDLFPQIGFIVTNLTWRSKPVPQFYNQRSTAEQWIKEGKTAPTWTRLSCHDFPDNEVRLQLFSLAYNLGNFIRCLALPRRVKLWSLTTLREKLIKIGAKVVHHSRYVTFLLANVAVPRELYPVILKKIDHVRPLPGPG